METTKQDWRAPADHTRSQQIKMRDLRPQLSLFTAACAVLLLGVSQFVSAKPLDAQPHQRSVPNLLPRQVITPGGAPCGQNNATNRACWKNSWNISTDYEVTNPPAFNTVNVSLAFKIFCPASCPLTIDSRLSLGHSPYYKHYQLGWPRWGCQACYAHQQ